MASYINQPTVDIRPARSDELSLLGEVERSAGQAFASIPELKFIAELHTPSVPLDQLQQLVKGQNGGHILVACVPQPNRDGNLVSAAPQEADDNGQEIVGFLVAHDLDSFPYIAELSVARPYQGRGIGRRLMDSFLTLPDIAAAPLVYLTTYSLVSWNRPWYEKHFGFQVLDDDSISSTLGKELAKKKIEEDYSRLSRGSYTRCCMIRRRNI